MYTYYYHKVLTDNSFFFIKKKDLLHVFFDNFKMEKPHKKNLMGFFRIYRIILESKCNTYAWSNSPIFNFILGCFWVCFSYFNPIKSVKIISNI